MKEIFLIRHGRQCSALCNVNVELAKEGREQAELLGQRLKNYRLEKIYSSTLIRARETAEILNQYLGLPYEVLSDIEEINFGGLTGKTTEEIERVYGAFRKERARHKEDIPYPDGGECGGDVVRRALPQIKKLCRRPEQRIGIVTHGGVIRSLCAEILHSSQCHKLKFGIDLENTSLTELLYDEERDFFFLERFNDFAHLEGKEKLLRKGWVTSLEKK